MFVYMVSSKNVCCCCFVFKSFYWFFFLSLIPCTQSHSFFVPSYPSPALATLPPPTKTQMRKIKNSKCVIHLMVEFLVCHDVLHGIPLWSHIFIPRSHWCDSWFLASVTPFIMGPYQDSSWLSCCCPVSCSFESAGPALSSTPTVHRWWRILGGPSQTL